MTDRPLTAAQAAIAKARRHMGTAALAAAIMPLSSIAAHATVALPPSAETITGMVSSNGSGGYTYDYHVANATGAAINLVGIEIPELTSGDLSFFSLPASWIARQVNSATFPGSLAGAKNGTPSAAYIDLLFANGSGHYTLSSGSSIDFFANSSIGVTTSANVSVATGTYIFNAAYTQIDPPIPASVSAAPSVPEPASAAVFGAGLLALLGRKRRNI